MESIALLFHGNSLFSRHIHSVFVLKPVALKCSLAFPHLLLLRRFRSSDSAVSGLLVKSTPEEVDAATSPIPPQCRLPPPLPHLYLKRGQQNHNDRQKGPRCKVAVLHSAGGGGGDSGSHLASAVSSGGLSRQLSLHSLLEALPAASVDNDSSSEAAAAAAVASEPSHSTAIAVGHGGKKRASLSSLSLDSRSSDYDSYFYI